MKRIFGFTNGCFDLLHPGHIATIRYAASRCDFLLVAVNSDASVKRLKGEGRPIQTETERCAIVGAIKGVTGVLLLDEDSPWALVEKLMPDVWVKGDDGSNGIIADRDEAKSLGIRFEVAPRLVGLSNTSLLERIGRHE